MNIEVVVKKGVKDTPRGLAVPHTPPYNQRYGAWGRVDTVYSKNHTADVFLDTGVFLKQVPVASKEWVMSGDDYTTGKRDLPPEQARVFVFMPYGVYDSCFILCSGFVVTDKAQKQAFMEDEKEKIRKRVTPGNWKEEYHYATGTYELISPDEKTSLKIDYGTEQEAKDPPELHLKLFDKIKADIISDKSVALSTFDDEVKIEHTKGDSVNVTIFDTKLTIKKGEVTVKPKKTTIEVDGDAAFKTSGNTVVEVTGDTIVKGANINVEATEKAVVKAAQVHITGGNLQVDGTTAPNAGPFCAIPACLVTGTPHGGNTVAGT